MKKYSILIKSYCGAPDFEDEGNFKNKKEAVDYWHEQLNRNPDASYTKEFIKKNVIEEFDPYCEVCEGCGFIGCCGIKNFLEEHVRGKTNCKNEDMFIDEIISWINEHDKQKQAG